MGVSLNYLRQLFCRYGTVIGISFFEQERSMYAKSILVTYNLHRDARAACDALNGVDFFSRGTPLVVQEVVRRLGGILEEVSH